MKTIMTRSDVEIQVSDEDYDELSKLDLFLIRNKTYVAVAIPGKWPEYLHRWLMKPGKGMVVDHIDGNKMNNVRENLRICTQQENTSNRKAHSGRICAGSSKYKGVRKMVDVHRSKPWIALIAINGKQKTLGSFATEIEAAHCYDEYAKQFFGEFAKTNFHTVDGEEGG